MDSIVKFERSNGHAAEPIARTVIRKANAAWLGTTRAGSGTVSIGCAAPDEKPFTFATYFESGRRSDPAGLLAAAHAGCFIMNLAVALRAAGYTASELSAEAVVTLEPDGANHRVSRSALTVRARAPSVTQAEFEAIAWYAVHSGPISKALRAQITLDAKLI
jgi:osmotically inducible protein OsmC